MVLYVMAAIYPELTGSRIYDVRMNKCVNTIFLKVKEETFYLFCPCIVKTCGGKDLLKYFEVHICVKITPRCDTGV